LNLCLSLLTPPVLPQLQYPLFLRFRLRTQYFLAGRRGSRCRRKVRLRLYQELHARESGARSVRFVIGLDFYNFICGSCYRGDVAVGACAEGGEMGVVGLKGVWRWVDVWVVVGRVGAKGVVDLGEAWYEGGGRNRG
jgi:hypothetical protein